MSLRKIDFFPVGATYAPLPKATEVDISEWETDIANMHKLGFNTFRLFICRDRIEPRHGIRDYSRVDRAFALAEQYGMRVVVNIGGTFANLQGIYAPRWLVYDCGCTLHKPAPDASEELHFNRFKLCGDDPVYQAETKDFIQDAVRRYKDRPALLAWSGWNEPHRSECFCRHTIAAFREYLKRKYTDLDTLARAWSTEFPLYFRTWEDVFPQPKADFENGGYTPFLDWKAFLTANLVDKFNKIKQWIREMDAETPVLSHIGGPYEADLFDRADILGTSVYTIHGQGKCQDYSPWEFAMRNALPFLAEGRRSDRDDPFGFWVVETEAGPVSWVHNLVPRSYSARKLNARDMLCAAYGARAILRWLYRSRVSDAQAGEFNLVGWDGRMTDRAEEFGSLARFFQSESELFLTHRPDPAGVYVLSFMDTADLFLCEGFAWRYTADAENLIEGLRHCGVTAERCCIRQIREGLLNSAKLLFIPFRPYLDPDDIAILRDFVERGGMLVAEAPFAIKNTQGIHYEVTPGGMTDLFGAQVYDLLHLEEDTCAGIPAYDFHAKIDVRGGVIEGCFDNGDPAIVSHRYGAGRTVLYGTIFASRYQLERPLRTDDPQGVKVIDYQQGEPFRAELRKRLAEAGVKPQYRLEASEPGIAKNIWIIPRRLPDGKRILFVINIDDRPHGFRVVFPGMTRVAGSSGEVCTIHGDHLELHLNAWGWAVFTEEKEH